MTGLRKILAVIGMFLFLIAEVSCVTSPPHDHRIYITASPQDPKTLIIRGLPPNLVDFIGQGGTFTVSVSGAPAGAPSISGDLRQERNDLVFSPRYPFQPGLDYRADIALPATSSSSAGGQVSIHFKIPTPPAVPVVRIDAVYPSANELPENLLKFYIQFSGPMSRGEAYQHIHLLEDTGHSVPAPFLELDQELWNSEMTRFTLFFDPGRIKQGLVPRLEMGLALDRGRSYTLVIDSDWQDGEHRPLVTSVQKQFRVVPADTRQPDPSRWQLSPPPAASTQPLTIHFEKPLDHALLERVLSIHDAAGQRLSGRITISNHEQQWSFTPDSPWSAGGYTLVVQTILEDTAGNSIGRPFEVDLNKTPATTAPATIELPIKVR